MATGHGVFNMERLFRALADRTRLRLLNLISEGEVCVCFFVEVLGTPQPKISRHLAYLRRAGIVAARREGKWMHYRLAPPKDLLVSRILTEVRSWLAEDREMQLDRARLVKVCCSPGVPLRLQAAPRPASLSGESRTAEHRNRRLAR
ncbi:MAG: metalloregulator ArsR/SmtB family transcription factor [Acidobacteria bacterium]|nr:metalloregulator ArsR/SmtB family transcription factor [Acidobacteriota bacterium]